MGEHRNIGRWREMREAFFRGEVEPALELYHPDIVWTNDEAAGPLAGEHRGLDAVLTMLGAGMELFHGTLEQEIHDTLASGDHVVEIMTERATVNGNKFENRAVYLYRLRDDKIVEVATLDRDREAAARFWSSISSTA